MELPELFTLLNDWPTPADLAPALERRRELWRGLSSFDAEMTDRFLFPNARGGRHAFLK